MHVTPLLVYDAVTVKVEVMGVLLVLLAVNEGTLPVPLVAPRPISGVGTVRLQENVDPATGLLKTIEGTTAPSQ